MFGLIFTGLALIGALTLFKDRMAIGHVVSNFARNPGVMWGRMMPPIMVQGQHYPVALSFNGKPDAAQLKTVLSTMFAAPTIYLPGDPVGLLPNPYPPDWLEAFQGGGDVIVFGQWQGSVGADTNGGINAQALAPLGYVPGSAKVWVSTEDYTKMHMGGGIR